jgi:hypothetical protein
LQSLIGNAIDPKKSLGETTRTALVQKLLNDIDKEIAADQAHITRVERLWSNAKRSSYANGHLSRIIDAYLERAKTVLPKHARKVKEEHGIAEEKDEKDERRPEPQRQKEGRPPVRPVPGGNAPHKRTLRETSPRDIDWRKSKDEDILAGKAYLKRR